MATKAEREPAVPEESRKPAPQLLSAEQRGQMISVLRNPTAPLDSLSFDPSRLVELSLAECIGAPGTAARIAADAPFLSSMSSLTALDLSCSLREAHEANGHDGAFEAGLLASLLKILEAMPSALSALTLPESIGDFCLTGYGEGLGATLGRMKGTITSLTIRSAIQGVCQHGLPPARLQVPPAARPDSAPAPPLQGRPMRRLASCRCSTMRGCRSCRT